MPAVEDRTTDIAAVSADLRRAAEAVVHSAPEAAQMLQQFGARFGQLLSTLTAENAALRQEIADLRAQLAHQHADEDADDHRWFGANLRRTWRELTTGR